MIDIKYYHLATAWLNGKRDYDEGISIMREARFRPGVVNKLEKDKGRPFSRERMLENMRALVSAFCVKDDSNLIEDTDAELHVFNGAEDVPTVEPTPEEGILAHENDPGNVGLIVHRYAELNRERHKLHNELKKVGELNDAASCVLRQQISEQIEHNTDAMEKIYPLYEKYCDTGQEPTDEEVSSVLEPVAAPSEEDAPADVAADLSTMSRDELVKLQYNIAKRISRSKNKLLYQNENRLEVENPMPDSPKRVRIENRIAHLEQELERVKYRIAELSI